MNLMATKLRSLAVLAAALTATLGTGCSSRPKNTAVGAAKVGATINAQTATNIVKMTLTVGVDATSGAPSFPNIVTDLTNNDPSNKLTWSGYVQSIPAGTLRLFSIQAFDATNKVIYSGSVHADVTVGNTAIVNMMLQGPNDGGLANSLPKITALTSSANIVTIGTTPPPGPVTLTFRATDPDPAATMTFQWASTCPGTSFDAGTGNVNAASDNVVHWTAPTSVPAGGACTLSLKVIDEKNGSVTAYLAIQIQQSQNGAAVVNAYPNSWPMISGLVVNETFTKDSTGKIVAVDYDLVANATDSDGDDVKYAWSVGGTGCQTAGSGYTATAPLQTTPVLTLAYGPGQNGSSTVHFHSTDLSNACVLRVDVTDSWKNGIVPAGSGLPVARGGDTVGTINGSLPSDFAIAPQITNHSAPTKPQDPQTASSATYTVNADQTVSLQINVSDPTPSYSPPGTPFTYVWTQSGGAFATGSETDVTSSPGSTSIQWIAAHTYAPNSYVTATVTSAQGVSSSYTWYFKPANPCDGSAGSVGLACDTGLGLCAPNGQCTASGTCVDSTAKVCAAPDQCHQAGVCDPSSGQCTYQPATAGTGCNADGNGCTLNDACDATGVCVAGTGVSCNTPTDAQCQSASGTCVSSGANSYTCQYVNAANSTPCNADSNGCTQSDSCQNGLCTQGAAVTCSQSANPCQASSGTCVSGGIDTHTCTFANINETGTCNTAGACITGQTCLSGTCQGGTPYCAAGTSCDPAGPTCNAFKVAPQVARDVPISGPVGLAMDTSGNAYVAGAVYGTVTLDGHPVTSNGDADVILASYDVTGHATWAVGYGDATNPQVATGAAVTNDGTLAVIGNFSGAMTIGSNSLSTASQIDFLAGMSKADGSGKWAKQFNDGANGALKAVAANPADASAHGNRIAACGFANGVAPSDFVSGAVTANGNDIIIGVFKSDGTRLWAKQLPGSGSGTVNEDCLAVAVDDNGDVYAAGTFSGTSLNFGGSTSALTGPGASTRKYLWVAKFDGATGAAIASQAFSGTLGSVAPTSLAVDAAGDVAVVGQFTSNVTIGTTLTSVANQDVFAAKLTPALAPTWAVSMGGGAIDVAYGVAFDSYGDVIATGLFNRTATISNSTTTLTATTTTASNPFVLKLHNLTGALDFAEAYGDIGTSSGDAIAVNRFGADQVALAGSFAGTLSFGTTGVASPVTAVNPSDVWFMTAILK